MNAFDKIQELPIGSRIETIAVPSRQQFTIVGVSNNRTGAKNALMIGFRVIEIAEYMSTQKEWEEVFTILDY